MSTPPQQLIILMIQRFNVMQAALIQMEIQCHQPVYASVLDLMKELKGIGAHNVSVGRNKKITTKAQMQRMISAYPAAKSDRITATFEVITIIAKA